MIPENPLWEGSARGRLFFRSREHQQFQHEAVAARLPKGRKRLLDYGCGYGDFIAHLPSGYIYEGVDDNPDVIESARELYPGYTFHTGREIRRADVIVAIATVQCKTDPPFPPPHELVQTMLDNSKLLVMTVDTKTWPGNSATGLFPDGVDSYEEIDDFIVLVKEGNL